MNFKISKQKKNKYKIKFLYSIINSDFNKSVIYLKKYSQYHNPKRNLIGGATIEMDEVQLKKFVDNILGLLDDIYDEKGDKFFTEKFNNDEKVINLYKQINGPVNIDFDKIIKNIFETVFVDKNIIESIDKIIEEKVREVEAERKAKEEAKEAERKAIEEAERKSIEEAERKSKEEAERKSKEEAERKAIEEAERKSKEEAERKSIEEAERKAKEEAERKAKEEAEKTKVKPEVEAKKTKVEAEKKEEVEKPKEKVDADKHNNFFSPIIIPSSQYVEQPLNYILTPELIKSNIIIQKDESLEKLNKKNNYIELNKSNIVIY
jgi:flagellar biosynthesis GTPase FlhF